MGKKSKLTSTSPWIFVVEDFKTEQKLLNDNPVFDKLIDAELSEKVLRPIITNGKSIGEILDELVKLKEYLKSRSDRLFNAFNKTVNDIFNNICITLPKPFDEMKWHNPETMENEDLNKTEITFNGIKTTPATLLKIIGTFLKSLEVKVISMEVFPFEIDSYGLPPINCRKIWHPLLWLRIELEKKVGEVCPNVENMLIPLITNLNLAPKEGHLKNMLIPSFFLEKTTATLDYSNSENKIVFMDKLKSQFGSLKVDTLMVVLPDILIAYSEELAERMMQVSYFIPFELLHLMFHCWRPSLVKLRLRTEACSSLEDASRIDWDDEEVFTSVTLYNSTLFDRCEPVSLGDEPHIKNCTLVVDASGSRLFDPVHNEKNVETVGRDFLTVFSMKNIFVRRTLALQKTNSVKAQIKSQLKFILHTFFCHANEQTERQLNFELKIENSEDVQMSIIKKCIGEITRDAKYGVDFNADPAVFDKFTDRFTADSPESRNSYVSFFDAENQFILDLLVVLSSRSN